MIRKHLLPAMVALGLVGCADAETDSRVTLTFAALANGQAVACGQTYAFGAADVAGEIKDLRFYVHDVRLLTADGDEVAVTLDDDGLWQNGDVALLDFEDKTGACTTGTADTRHVLEGTARAGDYAGVAFKLGVPEELNHQDAATATSPLNLTSMFWSWTGGYKFFRLDLDTDDGGWLFHVGSTACSGDPASGITCSNGNRPEARVTGIDPSTDAITLDLDALLGDASFGADHSGCHAMPSEPDCAVVMPPFGLSIDGSAPPTQSIFVAP